MRITMKEFFTVSAEKHSFSFQRKTRVYMEPSICDHGPRTQKENTQNYISQHDNNLVRFLQDWKVKPLFKYIEGSIKWVATVKWWKLL